MKNPEQKADAWTDKELKDLEKKLAESYGEASKDLEKEWQQYIKGWDEIVDGQNVHHAGLNERYQKEYKAYLEGKYTKEQFEAWYRAQVGRGKRWEDMKDQMANRMTESNEIASGYINGKLPGVYAKNSNAIAGIARDSAMEQGVEGVRFDLVDESTVKNLMLEKSNAISFRTVRVNPKRDYEWNAKRIQNALTQGILQGDSIDKLSKRFLTVMGSNEKAAIRNARTSVTSARSAGKQDRYDDLAAQGCDITKVWVATDDERTREAHIEADGQEVDKDAPFDVGGEDMMYPGDPNGSPWNVYNCRCTMRTGRIKFNSILSDEMREKANIQIIENTDKVFMRSRENDKEEHGIISSVTNNLLISDIEYKEVKRLKKTLKLRQIVKRLSNSDKSSGSCSSLAFAYIANKYGLDVIDGRGGESMDFFAHHENIEKIAKLNGVNSLLISDSDEFRAVNKLLETMVEGKEYYLAAGAHASIVRTSNGRYQYLEMQGGEYNGYKELNDEELKERFDCRKPPFQLAKQDCVLIEAKSLYDNDEFKYILGYINNQ